MKRLRKISQKIFWGIFAGTIIVFSLASLSDFIYSRKVLSGLMRSLVEHSFDASYSRFNAQVERVVIIAQSTGAFLMSDDLNSKKISSISKFNYSHFNSLKGLSFSVKDLVNNSVQYYNCSKDGLIKIGDSSLKKGEFNSDNVISIRTDTVLYSYNCSDSLKAISVFYEFDLKFFIDLLNEKSQITDNRYYLFDQENTPVKGSNRRLTEQSELDFLVDIDAARPFVTEGREGFVTVKESHTDRAYYIKRINALDITLVTSMKVDLVLKKYNRYFKITFLITIFFVLILAYVLQRIIVKLTRPITELSDISRKIQQGSLHTHVPDFTDSGEAAEMAEALRSVQGKMKQYVSDLNSTLKTKRELDHELKIANKIQTDMIPAPFRALQEMPEVDIYAKMNPAKGVAGDFYDYFFIDKDKLFFVIGDVSGKGIPAALFMVKATTLIEHTIHQHPDPAKAFEIVNDNLCLKNEESMFVTAIGGIVDIKTGELILCDAGHNTPFLTIGQNDFKYHEIKKGRPLGIINQGNYSNTVFNLQSSDTLLLYTDGFPECVGKSGDMVGEELLQKQLEGVSSMELTRIADKLWNFIDDFRVDTPPSDDTTLLILRYVGEKSSSINKMKKG